MSVFLLKRLFTLVAILLVASVLIFGVLENLSGNAAQMQLGPDAAPEAIAAKEVELGLNQPADQRYGNWIRGLLRGDMGLSYTYATPVTEMLRERLAVTLPLAVMALALTIVLALATGIFAASRHQGWQDAGIMGLAQLGIAIPNFWFAILLILLFSVKLQWFSAGGFPGWTEADGGGLWPAIKALLLPAISLAVVQAAILARVTRSAVLEVLREDYVRTARAKGLSRRAVLWRHVLRNAMISIVTVMGLQFASLLAGTIVVERVFYLPGLGDFIFQAIGNRDTIVLRNCVMLLVLMVVCVNFVVDVLYALIDPRIEASSL